MIGDKIGNHTVIESIVMGNTKIVIGKNPDNMATPYATWMANMENDPHSYFWGHYCTTKEGALADYGKRIQSQTELLQTFKQAPTQKKEIPDRER